jgi:hypothetical protein
MPYAVVTYFDKKSDQTIRNIWKELADADVCSYLYESENSPHIKLGMYDELNVEKTKEILEEVSKTTKRQRVHFKNIGIYPHEKPIVFLDMSVSGCLLEFQKQVCALFESNAHEIGSNYFEPGIWKPDCFLTVSIEREKVYKAIDLLMRLKLPFDGFIERIGLIEFHPARQIFSYRLME